MYCHPRLFCRVYWDMSMTVSTWRHTSCVCRIGGRRDGPCPFSFPPVHLAHGTRVCPAARPSAAFGFVPARLIDLSHLILQQLLEQRFPEQDTGPDKNEG